MLVEIGQLADVVSGGTPKASDPDNFVDPGRGIAWLTPADLSRYQRKLIKHGARDLSEQGYANCSAQQMPEGALLFSSRAPIGYVAVAEGPVSTNQGFRSFVFSKEVDSSFAYYYLKHIRPLAESMGTGTTFKELSGANARRLPFLLPPHKEQQQIAARLDGLLAQADSIKTRLDAIPGILKRFRQSVLAAAVSGRLTEDWRIENDRSAVDLERLFQQVAAERKALGFKAPKTLKNDIDSPAFSIPDTWKWVRLGAVALKITDGAHNTPKVIESGFPYLMAKDLTGGVIDFSERRYISEENHRELHNKCRPEVGDLLVVNIGAGTGNNASVDVNFEFSFKNIAIIKRPEFVHPRYLKWFFDARKETIFSEQTRGGAQPFLSITLLNSLEFALPPAKEQAEIVERIQNAFAFTDLVEQRIFSAQARINRLPKSTLSMAFRGDLTAEWRKQNPDLISGENSAEALLARIRDERGSISRPRRSQGRPAIKRKGEKSAMTISILEALEKHGQPLDAQALLAEAGYPKNASTEDVERFMLDVRTMLDAGKIRKERIGNQDVFSLAD